MTYSDTTMDVVINSEIKTLPPDVEEIKGQRHFYLNFLYSLGFSEQQLPLAQLLSQLHHLTGEWLVLSPVHWQATHNDAMIIACDDELGLTAQESRQWFNELATFLKYDGFEMVYHDTNCWLLSKNAKPDPKVKTVYQMLHRSMMPELSVMDDSFFWQQFITETQMFFSSNPMNQKRMDEHKLTINGVWVWGGGALNPSQKTVYTSENLASLARLCSENVSIYTAESRLKQIDCLLVNNHQDIDPHHLTAMKRHLIRWYWNNYSYCNAVKPWWQRLWRRIKNAH